MTTEPFAYVPPKINRQDLVKALGTHVNPGSFEGKMRCVYELIEVVIEQVEEKYEKVIKSGWKGVFPDLKSASLDARYQNHKRFSPKTQNAITDNYKQILKNANDLKNQLAELEILSNSKTPSSCLKESINLYLSKASYSQMELTAAIPFFFALQHHAWTLDCYLVGRFTLIDKEVRKKRAANGGEASNEGRAELIEDFRKFLSTIQQKEKFEAIEGLLSRHNKGIASILEAYNKTSSSKDKKPYKIPKFENIIDKFQEWYSMDKGFQVEIDRLVQKK